MSVLMAKSILTTVVLLMAIAQAASMSRSTGALKVPPLPHQRLRLWHRRGGDATLILTLVIAVICVIHAPFRIYPLRVPLHAILGTLAAMVMIVKAIIARRFRRYLRYARLLGALAGFSILGCFAASALWYFGSLLQVASPPPMELTPTHAVTSTATGGDIAPTQVHSPTVPVVKATPPEQPNATPIPRVTTPSVVRSPTTIPLASGPELLQDRCTPCHGLDRVDHPHTRDQWESVVELMKRYGATLTDDETQVLVEYLAESYGP